MDTQHIRRISPNSTPTNHRGLIYKIYANTFFFLFDTLSDLNIHTKLLHTLLNVVKKYMLIFFFVSFKFNNLVWARLYILYFGGFPLYFYQDHSSKFKCLLNNFSN